MSDSVRPHRRQPTRLHHPWDSPGKNTGVGCHFLLQCMKVKSGNEVAQLCPTLSNSMACSLPGSSIHGIFQEEYWSGLSFPPPGHIPTQGLNLHLLHLLHWQAGSTSPIFTLSSTLNTAIGTYPGSRFLYLLWTMAINFYLVPLPPVLFPNEQLPIAVQ